MAYEVTGRLITKYDVVQRSESFKTREFVIEVTEDFNGRAFTNYVKFQCVQDRTSMPDRFNIGDEVKVTFNLRGSKWERDGKVNYITNLDAWRMESIKLSQDTPGQMQPPNQPITADTEDDLPF